MAMIRLNKRSKKVKLNLNIQKTQIKKPLNSILKQLVSNKQYLITNLNSYEKQPLQKYQSSKEIDKMQPAIKNQTSQKYTVKDQEIRRLFNSRKFKPLQEMQSKILPLVQEIQLQKQQLTNDPQLSQTEKQQCLKQLDSQIESILKPLRTLEAQLYKSFSAHVRNELKKIQESEEQLTKHYENQKWEEPIMELLAAKNLDWMKEPLPTIVIPLIKKSQEPVTTVINQKVQLIINKIQDSQGKTFEGTVNLKSSTCDSLNQPQKLKSLPPLLVFDQNDRQAPPASKLVSFSMQTNQFQDEKGKLIFPTQPLNVVEKIDDKKIKPQVLKQYKVWNWDVLTQKWVETGSVQVSPDGKQLKYDIKPKSRQEMLRIFQSIGEPRRNTLPRMVFNVEKIKDLIPTVKQIAQAYDKEVKKAQIQHEYKLNELNNRAGIQATQKQIRQLKTQTQTLKKINQELKSSGKSLFYDLVSDYFLKKDSLKPGSPLLTQELIYIPQEMRDVESHFIYRSLNRLNKKSFPFKLNSQKHTIRPEQYEKYADETILKSMAEFTFQGDLKKDDNVLKEIYVESPNRKFVEKYILVHPKTPFFIGDAKLQKINRDVDVETLIRKLNSETLMALQHKISTWSLKRNTQCLAKENMVEIKEQGFKGISHDLSGIYEQEQKTVAQLVIESRLNKIKLISTNKYMLRLQIAILFALPLSKLQQFESQLIYAQKLNQKDTVINQRYISSIPHYQSPTQRFLSAYCEFFKTYADEHEETLRGVFTTHVRNSLEIEEKTMMMEISDPSVNNFIKEIDQVFAESTKKGLFSLEQMQQLKRPKIERIKREYLVVNQWNKNQHLIQRIYSEFFPTCPYTTSTYTQLIESMINYCDTRSVLMSEKDIDKFSVEFNSKYRQYRSQSEKGLPGGAVDGRALLATLTQKYGAQAANAAMYTICNIDRLMNLTEQQAKRFVQRAQSLATVNRNNIPQFVARKKSEVTSYLNNPTHFTSNINPSLLTSNTNKSLASLNQATQTIEKQKRQNDLTISTNLGTNSTELLKENKRIKNQFQKKLSQIKPVGLEVKPEKKGETQKSLNSVNQLNSKLNRQVEDIDALADDLNERIKVQTDPSKSDKLMNQAIEKTIQIIEQRKQTLQKGTHQVEKEIIEQRENTQKQMQKVNKKDPQLENTKTRVKNRNRRIQELKSIEQLLIQEEENIKLAASNSVKDLLGQKK